MTLRYLAMAASALVASVVATSVIAQAQTTPPPAPLPLQLASAAPRFLSAPTAHAPSVDVSAAPVFQRRVDLEFDRVPLKDALVSLGRQAHIHFVASDESVALDRPVSVSASHLTVAAALTEMLIGTGVDVQLAADESTVSLIPRHPNVSGVRALVQGTGIIAGFVRDSATGTSIPQVTVRVDGTALQVKSGADGSYKIPGVAAGEYRVTARRVGYLAKTRMVTVADGENKILGFELNPPATQLNEVVTTALGEQRRYEVGNVISTINVDSIAPNAPVTSVTDLMTGRVPGLEVVESSGLAGAGEALRLRGQSSMLLQGDPIVIVDGIREENTPGGSTLGFSACCSPAPSRINDLDFSQIATIDVLKGPTATAEYGTDAANGVIVITTKRGVSGSPQWNVSGNYTANDVPTSFPDVYYSWGQSTNGTAALVGNPLSGQQPCGLGFVIAEQGYPTSVTGQCVVDSVTAFNPLSHAATTVYGTGPSTKYDASVGGGSDILRYYIAGGISNTLGVLHLPDAFRGQALALGYPASDEDPNSYDQGSLRLNTTIHLARTLDVQSNVAFMSTYESTPAGGTLGALGLSAPSINDAADAYGWNYANGYLGINPLQALGQTFNQQTTRWTGGGTMDWRPVSWLSGHMTVGVDHETQLQQQLYTPQAELVQSQYTDSSSGSIEVMQGVTDIYTVDLRGSATATALRYLHLLTTVGAQYEDTKFQDIDVFGYNLMAENFTLDGATHPDVVNGVSGAATLGVYVEENLNVANRCFVPLALRFDAASGFGQSVAGGGATYPKYGVSCLVLTGNTTLRIRTEFGAAGVQPPYGADLTTFQTNSYQLGNASSPTTGYAFTGAGNAELKPEHDQEMEGGADLGLWGNRVSVSLTAYTKYAHNALYTLPSLGWTINGSYTENLGDVRNTGAEAAITTVITQQRDLSLAVTVNGAVNHNKLLRLAPGILGTTVGNFENQYFNAGYPLYGYWGDSLSYRDANGDGILEANEVTAGQTLVYQGSSIPIEELSIAPSVGLWRNAIVVNALFDYQGGFKVFTYDGDGQMNPATNVLGAPLWEQAAYGTFSQNYSQDFLSGNYLSFRELSVAVNLPRAWARAARFQHLSVVAAVRNLALWTTYPFGDPEVSASAGSSDDPASGTQAPNNDVRLTSMDVVPLTRQWTLRLNLGL